MSDDFSTHPQSISELRADRSGLPRDLSPRDVLIRVLRAMDAGEIAPDHVVIIMGNGVEDAGSRTAYHQGGSYSYHAQLGLIHRALSLLSASR